MHITGIGPGGLAVDKTDGSLCPHGPYILVGGDCQDKNLKLNFRSGKCYEKNQGEEWEGEG